MLACSHQISTPITHYTSFSNFLGALNNVGVEEYCFVVTSRLQRVKDKYNEHTQISINGLGHLNIK